MKTAFLNHSLNHRKLVLTNSKHNFFHYFIVVFLRIIYSIFIIPFSAYAAAFGIFLAYETIKPYSPPGWLEQAIDYSNKLPYFIYIKYYFIKKLAFWYQDALVWWAIVVGLPLILLAGTVFLINFFNLYYSIFSPFYNRTHCPFCKQPIRIR